MSLGRLLRSACTDCGCVLLEWMSGAEYRRRYVPDSVNWGDLDSGEFWRCPSCGASGVFAPS